MTQKSMDEAYTTAIAIIGMSGRFPGAGGVEAFWDNLVNGHKAVRFFSDEELLEAGVPLEELQQSNYVRAGTVLPDIEKFDAAFFGYTPREAEIIDPQQRVLLEVAWEALEAAGYNPETYQGMIGVFAGAAISTYLLNNIFLRPDVVNLLGPLPVSLGNDKDSLATRVSYKLNLRGPSIAVQTYCSSSLVSVHLGCQSLLNYECDMVLAGGVAIAIPQVSGYLYQEGGLLPPDGESRPFDAGARGSLKGNGAGMVVLKRLSEALEDGDHIHAVIRGSAVNNDGRFRASYAAPGLEGQSEVIAEALANAEVEAESIGYIETHGTATALGDAIELGALIKAFELTTTQKRFCVLGSVKPNIGHLDRASGVTGLIKTALALQHQQLPALLNFTRPHPDVNLANSPFYINTETTSWPRRAGKPRRAGVSSFGMGGTNAHVILEEAPAREPAGFSRSRHLLVLSARTESALASMSTNLASHLRRHPAYDLADVAYTLLVGRAVFPHRRVLVCQDRDEAIALLEEPVGDADTTLQDTSKDRQVAFLLPGTGFECAAKTVRCLLAQDPAFAGLVQDCLALLKGQVGLDLTALLSGPPSVEETGPQRMVDSQVALFILEYALAHLLMQWGVQPEALFGEGVGEYVAACLAGVFSLEHALLLIVRSAQWRQECEPGTNPVSLREPLGTLLAELPLHAPTLPFISSVTGTWITAEQAASPAYWREQICTQANALHGIETFVRDKHQVMLEIGPGQSLGAMLKGHTDSSEGPEPFIFSTLPTHNAGLSAQGSVLTALGKLWLTGVSVDWAAFYKHERRFRVPLPTYPFERQRHWIEAPGGYARQSISLVSERGHATGTVGATIWPGMDGQAPNESGPWVLFVEPAALDPELAGALKRALAGGALQPLRSAEELQTRLRHWAQIDEAQSTQTTILDRSSLSTTYAPPENLIEEVIVEMWEQVLGLGKIGIRDNFFELGGHSLIGTRLISRLRQRFQVDIPLAILFETATIEDLALIVGELLLKEMGLEETPAVL